MAAGEKQSLSYERPPPSPVPRWQFRLLFLLVLINLAITIQVAYAPGVTASVGKWWADYTARRRQLALYRKAAAWSAPAGTVAWEEEPTAAAKLRSTGNYTASQVPYTIRYGNFPHLRGWPQGATVKPPAFARQLEKNFPVYDSNGRIPQSNEDWALLLLHGLRTTGGQERLVYVVVESKVELNSAASQASLAHPFTASGERRLRLIATPCVWDGSKLMYPQPNETTELFVAPGGDQSVKFSWRWEPPAEGKPGAVKVDSPHRFRFYTGQADPADASHFTIDYDLNDVRGKIHGRLNADGTVELKPEAGTVTPPVWDPSAR